MSLISRIKRALPHQVADKIEMAFANREVEWRRVVVLAGDQRRAAVGQFLHALNISVLAGGEHVPDVRSGRDGAVVKLHKQSLCHFESLDHVTYLCYSNCDSAYYSDFTL